MTDRRNFLLGAAALGTLGHPLGALAQANLELARIICGFPPGGTSDAISRRIADKLRGGYATNVVVDNKPGAGGQIGVTTLRDSPADGSAMLLTPSSMLSIYPFVYKNLPYKPLEDVQPVSLACYFNHAFGVGPAVPESVKTVKDFLAWAKANPTKANYGSPGAGSMPHLIVGLLNKLTGSDLKHIPYRGSAPGIQDLLGGQISAMSSPIGDYLPYLKTGKPARAGHLGHQPQPVCARRAPPTASKASRSRCASGTACSCPARPGQRWCAAQPPTCSPHWPSPIWSASMAQVGMEVQSSTSQVLGDLLKADADEWRRLIKQIGFTAES
jgi:tripartite-type tricarboxylate transporter receptor subunit TctC